MAKKETSPVASVRMPRGNAMDGRTAYINAMYDASDRARTAQLEAAYNKAASDMAAAKAAADKHYDAAENAYNGQANAAGDAVRTFAAPRGLNTGAGSQAAMAMSNQGIINSNAMGAARAQTEADIDRQREALDDSYMAERQKMVAANMQNRNQALYDDSVLADTARRQQAQFKQSQNQTAFKNQLTAQQKYLKELAKANKKKGSSGEGYVPVTVEPTDFNALYNFALEAIDRSSNRGAAERAMWSVMTPAEFAKAKGFNSQYSGMDDSYAQYLDQVIKSAGVNTDKLFAVEEEDAPTTGGAFVF